jgi:hypothetical protein
MAARLVVAAVEVEVKVHQILAGDGTGAVQAEVVFGKKSDGELWRDVGIQGDFQIAVFLAIAENRRIKATPSS